MTQEDKANSGQSAPPKGVVALAYGLLLIPALIPIYFVVDQDDPTLIAIMIGTSVTILTFNTVVLVVAYRWLSRGAE